jgi:hypothetical protein
MYRNPVLLAREWQKSLDDGTYVSRAALANSKGISRARVTQIMNLLRLSSGVLRTVTELGDPLPPGIITERWLRPLVGQPDDGQVDMLKVILAHRRSLRF